MHALCRHARRNGSPRPNRRGLSECLLSSGRRRWRVLERRVQLAKGFPYPRSDFAGADLGGGRQWFHIHCYNRVICLGSRAPVLSLFDDEACTIA